MLNITLMNYNKSTQQFLLGIHLDASSSCDDFDDVFSDDSNSQMQKISVPEVSSKIKKSVSIDNLQEIQTFSDANQHLTNLVNYLSNYKEDKDQKLTIKLINPELAPNALIIKVDKFAKDKNEKSFEKFIKEYSMDDLNTEIKIQIDIIRYSYNKELNLEHYLGGKYDSRIKSLLLWILSHVDDNKVSLAYLIRSAMEYIKTETKLPIAILYPEFNLDDILLNISQLLNLIFPGHPIVPSVFQRLADFSNKKDDILALINNDADIEDDMFSDFSSSFFEDLHPNHSDSVNLVFNFLDSSESNLLDFNSKQNVEVVSILDSPSTMTYYFNGKDTSMPPNLFIDWMNGKELKLKHKDKYIVKYNKKYSSIQDKISVYNLAKLKSQKYWTLHLPIYHYVNLTSITPFIENAKFPEILIAEYNVHHGFVQNDIKKIRDGLAILISYIPTDLDCCEVLPLQIQRKSPEILSKHTQKDIILQALIDAILIFNGISPLNFIRFPRIDLISNIDEHPVYDPIWRTQALYKLYSEEIFSPYLCFRTCFALGISTMEKYPSISNRLFFEGLVILLEFFPSLKSSLIVRNYTFGFAESLNYNNKYQYCALALDNSWRICIDNQNYANTAAKISQKNHDVCRALFFYHIALNIYIKNNQVSETMYTAQTIANIYKKNNQFISGLQVLFSIISKAYNFNVIDLLNLNKNINIQSNKMSVVNTELRDDNKLKRQRSKTYRAVSNTELFETKEESFNTLVTAIYLILFLIKTEQFTKANNLISLVFSKVKTPSLFKQSYFLLAKISYKKNDFNQFIDIIQQNDLLNLNNSSIHIKQFGIFNMSFKLLKYLSQGYFNINEPELSLFWSEIMLHILQQNKIKLIAKALYIRGLSLFELYKYYYILNKNSISEKLHSLELSVGKFKDNTIPSKKELLEESLSSLYSSKLLLDYLGLTFKSLKAMLLYCEFFVHELFMMDFSNSQDGNFQITIKHPNLFTVCYFFKEENKFKVEYEPFKLNKASSIEHLSQMLQNTRKAVSIYLEPILIIREQIVESQLNHIKQKQLSKENYFKFAFTNLQNYFFEYNNFMFKNSSIQIIKMFKENLQTMILLLLTFEKEFINEHLILFDMLNDIKIILHNRQTCLISEKNIYREPTTKVQSTILELQNPLYQDFTNTLIQFGVKIKEEKEENDIQKMYKQLKQNINLYCKNYLSEKKLYNLNSEICICIQKIIQNRRLNNDKQIKYCFNDIPKELQRSTIFLLHLYNYIVSYFPETGQQKVNDIYFIRNLLLTVNDTLSIEIGNNIFSKQFLYMVSSLVISSKNVKYDSFSEKSLEVGNVIFGNFKNVENIVSITLFTDFDLQILPFELMFKTCVVRCIKYFSYYYDSEICDTLNPNVVISKPFSHSFQRNLTSLKSSLTGVGCYPLNPVEYINEYKQNLPYGFSINEKIPKHFGNLIEFNQINTNYETDNFYILPYSNLIELTDHMNNLINSKYGIFMFVSSSNFEKVMKQMKKLYKKHYYNVLNNRVFMTKFQFISNIQTKLINELMVPIPIMFSNRNSI